MTCVKTVVAMNHGEVVQAGGPQDLFEQPATTHVGYFIGSPAMNVLDASLVGGSGRVPELGLDRPAPEGLPGGALSLGFRPEHLSLQGPGQRIGGRVTRVWFEALEQVVEVAQGSTRFRAPSSGTSKVGDELFLSLPDERLRLYNDGHLVA